MEPGVGLDVPSGCLPTQDVLWFYDSVFSEISVIAFKPGSVQV